MSSVVGTALETSADLRDGATEEEEEAGRRRDGRRQGRVGPARDVRHSYRICQR